VKRKFLLELDYFKLLAKPGTWMRHGEGEPDGFHAIQPGDGNRTTDLEDDDTDEILDDYDIFAQ
jgi:hypothetical protein